MDIEKCLRFIGQLRDYASAKDLDLYVVGSAAYRGALSNPEIFSVCDDIDCVFIYRRLEQMADCPFFRHARLHAQAREDLDSGRIQLFASKPRIDDIKLSLDFISLEYFRALAREPFLRQNSWRIKLTDTREKESNEYRSFFGKSHTFHKEMIETGEFFLYRLPIHLWENGEYYTGALYNKFIHNPYKLRESGETAAIHKSLLYNYSRHFHKLSGERPGADIFKAMLFRKRFSAETRNFIEAIEKLYQDGRQ